MTSSHPPQLRDAKWQLATTKRRQKVPFLVTANAVAQRVFVKAPRKFDQIEMISHRVASDDDVKLRSVLVSNNFDVVVIFVDDKNG